MSSQVYRASLPCADGELEYQVRHSRRRTLGLYVFADGRVEVRVPLRCARATIDGFLASRLDWVRRKQAEFAARPRPPVAAYVDGEPHPYLGRLYPLALQAATRPRVRLEDERIVLAAADCDRPERVAKRLQQWYRQQAAALFPARLAVGCERMAGYGVRPAELKLRWMKSRWGSCSRRGSITLNLELIKFPLTCLDYVIAHELCHLLEFNHGPRFYALMDAVMPDWREHKAVLRAGAPAREVD